MRAGAFAAVCVVLSQVGHDLMAARPAPPWAGWAALAGVGAVGYCLADRRRPAWWILLAVEVSQVCLHLWFDFCTPSGSGAEPMPMRMGADGMHATGHLALSHDGGVSLGMLGAHALAGCLAALWLYAGERALWRALRTVVEFLVDRTLRLLALLAATGPALGRGPDRVSGGRGDDEVAPKIAVLRHVLVRRGPPRAGGFPSFV
ncbi:hypothetical protein ACFFNX_45610 [Actinoallomurus acaciae]|uniref:MFS transporter n=2 Tax=Actinoallomurus acaciae TaxID=502577 RepID=A0ABV5YY71_9ACTN